MQNQRKAFGVFFNTSVPVIMEVLLSVCPKNLLKSRRVQEMQPQAQGTEKSQVIMVPNTASEVCSTFILDF